MSELEITFKYNYINDEMCMVSQLHMLDKMM